MHPNFCIGVLGRVGRTGNERIQLVKERGEVICNQDPKSLLLNVSVVVSQNVSLRHDLSPGNLRMGLAQSTRHVPRCFPNDLHQALNRKLESAVRGIFVEFQAPSELQSRARCIHHVPQVG